MASRGRGRRERPRGTGQAQLVFDQQTFAEAVGITASAIAQAGIAGRQEDPSNLQRFRTHYPSTFKGEEVQWWPTIGSCISRKCYRLWRFPLT